MAAPRVVSTNRQKTTVRPVKPSLTSRPTGPKASINAPSYKPVTRAPKPVVGSTQKGWGAPATGPADAKPSVAPAAQPASDSHFAPDSVYNQRVDQAEKKGGQALESLESQGQAIKHDFGIDDPTNPFSRAEGLKRAYLARAKGQSAQLASQGQLYSGSHERAMARTRFDQEQAYNDLRNSYNQAMSAVNTGKQNAANMTEEEKTSAFEAWLSRAEDTMPEAPAEDAADAPSEDGPVAAPAGPGAPNNALFDARAQGDKKQPQTGTPPQPGSAPANATRSAGSVDWTKKPKPPKKPAKSVSASKGVKAPDKVKVTAKGLVPVKPKPAPKPTPKKKK